MFSITQIAKAAVISLVLTLSALAGAKLNLFGFEDATDAASDDVFQSLQAGDYGADRIGQDRVRVISIDEPGIEALRGQGWQGWPPGLDSLGIMLEDMVYTASTPPEAVFADLIITGGSIHTDEDRSAFDSLVASVSDITQADAWSGIPACSTDPLVRIACIIQAEGTPVILAKPGADETLPLTDAQRRLDAVAVLSPVLVGARAYPLLNTYEDQTLDGVRRFDLSPAAALYAAHCLHAILRADDAAACAGEPGFAEAAAAARAALGASAPTRPLPLEAVQRGWGVPAAVLWGDRLPEGQARITAQVSSGALPSCRDRVGLVTRTVQRMFGQLPQEAACAYAFHIGYDRLVAGFGLDEADYDFILADKLILIGSHMRNSDWAPTPVHGQLPGVHYHAMALDNLLEMGADYRRVDSAWLSVDDIFVSILTFVLLLAVILAVMARNSVMEDIRPEWKERRPIWALAAYYLALIVLVAGLTFLVALLGSSWWNRAVINWMGVAALAVGVLAMAGRLTLITDVGGPLGWIDGWTRRLEFQDRSLSKRAAPAAPTEPEPPEPAPTPPRRRRSAGADSGRKGRAPRSRRKPVHARS